MNKFIDKHWLDIMAVVMFAVVMILIGFSGSANAGSLVGQSAPDENGVVVCYYQDHNTGETYMKHSHYVCSSS